MDGYLWYLYRRGGTTESGLVISLIMCIFDKMTEGKQEKVWNNYQIEKKTEENRKKSNEKGKKRKRKRKKTGVRKNILKPRYSDV